MTCYVWRIRIIMYTAEHYIGSGVIFCFERVSPCMINDLTRNGRNHPNPYHSTHMTAMYIIYVHITSNIMIYTVGLFYYYVRNTHNIL